MKKSEMQVCGSLIKRNVQMFFKDKATFFTSLCTPIILLVLYVTFLYNVYETSYLQALPAQFITDESLVSGLVGGQLISSLLAVSTVTVPFCANLFMVQDKVTGARNDFTIAPVKPQYLAFGYYAATVINGLIISLSALVIGLGYIAIIGWYLSVLDVLLLVVDVVVLVLFGTALSSLVCFALTTQGQLSAVGTIVSAGYGFVCGAYMPISSFSAGLRNALAFFPGTHGTSLLRNHALQGVYAEMGASGVPSEVVNSLKDMSDCNLYLSNSAIAPWVSYVALIGSVVVMVAAYVILNIWLAKRANKKQK